MSLKFHSIILNRSIPLSLQTSFLFDNAIIKTKNKKKRGKLLNHISALMLKAGRVAIIMFQSCQSIARKEEKKRKKEELEEPQFLFDFSIVRPQGYLLYCEYKTKNKTRICRSWHHRCSVQPKDATMIY